MPALIIADNALTGRGIRWELRTYAPSLDVMGYVDRRSPCAAAVASANPDLVIIDELGTSEAALSFITSIREAAPAAKLLLLGAHAGRLAGQGRSSRHRRRGGEDIDAASLATPGRHAAAGNVFQTFAPCPTPLRPAATATPLTDRELEILDLLQTESRTQGSPQSSE